MTKLAIIVFLFCGNIQLVKPSVSECQGKDIDVVFLVDTSRSIKDPELALARTCVRTIIDHITSGSTASAEGSTTAAEIRISIITFDKHAKVVFPLGVRSYDTTTDLLPRPLIRSGTFTAKGLEKTIEELKNNGRPNVRQICVVVTDGKSSNPGSTKVIAEHIERNSKIIVIAIGVGTGYNIYELNILATGADEQNVYTTADFKGLLARAEEFAKVVCIAPSKTTLLASVSCRMPCLRNGVVTGKRHTGEFITFDCDPGFVLSGSKTAKCEDGGVWSINVKEIKCVKEITCPYIVAISHGAVEPGAENKIGDTVSFRADPGYELVGSNKLTCKEDGHWDYPRPTCRRTMCNVVSGVRNGHIIRLANFHNMSTEFVCNTGYTMIGSKVITCVNGQWDKKAPLCVKKRCMNKIISIKYGVIHEGMSGDLYTLKFICNDGFGLVGQADLICDEKGQWSSCFPTCQSQVCPDYPGVANGDIKKDGIPPFVTQITFTCRKGYKLRGESEVLRCIDGKWDYPRPSCIKNMCPGLVQVKHGKAKNYKRFIGSEVKYVCDPGYKISGESDTIKCLESGEWSSLIRCFPDTSITSSGRSKLCSSILDATCTGNRGLGESTECSCDPGFALNGESKLDCVDGVWNQPVPRCKPNRCRELHKVRGGKSSGGKVIPGSVVTFQCYKGFTLEGEQSITCVNGEAGERPRWTHEQPKCKPTRCKNIYRIRNGDAKGTGDEQDSVRRFQCDDGYLLVGETHATCRNGKWMPTIPKCIRNTCRPIQHVEYGTVTGSSFAVGNTIRLDCKPGYKNSGSARIKCTENRSWYPKANCLKHTCPEIGIIRHGRVQQYNNLPRSVVSFTCDDGYQVNGKKEIRCTDNAEWQHDIPVCEPIVKCPTLCLKRGNVQTRAINPPTRMDAMLTCDSGFELDGTNKANCHNGLWTMRDPDPLCNDDSCRLSLEMPTCIAFIPEECKGIKQDIVIVVDNGRQVGNRILQKMVSILRSLAMRFQAEKTRFSVVTFSQESQVLLTLAQYSNSIALEIADIAVREPQIKGSFLHEGIDEAFKQYIAAPEDRKRAMVLILSAPSADPEKATEAAQKAKDVGITVFSIGIKKDVDEDELTELASHENAVFTVDTPNELAEYLREIAIQICNSQSTWTTTQT